MSPIVERVRKLIALASSSNENEGRTAAFLACRLIREHGLSVVDGVSDTRRVRASPSPPPPRQRVTRGPYSRARHLRGEPRCYECSEPITSDDACIDGDGLPVHGDCIPSGERP